MRQLRGQAGPFEDGAAVFVCRAVLGQACAHDDAVLQRVAHDEVIRFDGDGHFEEDFAHGRGPAQNQGQVCYAGLCEDIEVIAPGNLRARHPFAHGVVQALGALPCMRAARARCARRPGSH